MGRFYNQLVSIESRDFYRVSGDPANCTQQSLAIDCPGCLHHWNWKCLGNPMKEMPVDLQATCRHEKAPILLEPVKPKALRRLPFLTVVESQLGNAMALLLKGTAFTVARCTGSSLYRVT